MYFLQLEVVNMYLFATVGGCIFVTVAGCCVTYYVDWNYLVHSVYKISIVNERITRQNLTEEPNQLSSKA